MTEESNVERLSRLANSKLVVESPDNLRRQETRTKADRLLMIEKAMGKSDNTTGVTLEKERGKIVLRYKGEPAYEGDKGRDIVITELEEKAKDPDFWNQWVNGPLTQIIGDE